MTHGNPRINVWTFPAGLSKAPNLLASCPCSLDPGVAAPPFLGENYFCESGISGGFTNGVRYLDHQIHDADIQSTQYSHLMDEYCTHLLTMPCTRRSPARLVGRIPPAEAVDGEIFIASAWASSNLGYAYLSSRCSHLLVSRLYTDRSIANFWEREDVLAMEAEPQRSVDFEYNYTSSRTQQTRAVEGHSLRLPN